MHTLPLNHHRLRAANESRSRWILEVQLASESYRQVMGLRDWQSQLSLRNPWSMLTVVV